MAAEAAVGPSLAEVGPPLLGRCYMHIACVFASIRNRPDGMHTLKLVNFENGNKPDRMHTAKMLYMIIFFHTAPTEAVAYTDQRDAPELVVFIKNTNCPHKLNKCANTRHMYSMAETKYLAITWAKSTLMQNLAVKIFGVRFLKKPFRQTGALMLRYDRPATIQKCGMTGQLSRCPGSGSSPRHPHQDSRRSRPSHASRSSDVCNLCLGRCQGELPPLLLPGVLSYRPCSGIATAKHPWRPGEIRRANQ